ncbi:hypothetical protein MRX96_004635 [Rhipicephalus microplus]
MALPSAAAGPALLLTYLLVTTSAQAHLLILQTEASTFITVFKIVVDQLDYEGIRLVRARQLEKQIRECFFMSGFPQAVGAIDGSHFAVSPPKKHASDYYNYK